MKIVTVEMAVVNALQEYMSKRHAEGILEELKVHESVGFMKRFWDVPNSVFPKDQFRRLVLLANILANQW